MSLIKKFASVGGATMASRLLGFVREAMMAAALGAGPISDAFFAAFRFPNLFRRLFAEGAFNAAFVPLFAKEIEGGGTEEARKFGEEVQSFLFFILLGLTILMQLSMPFLVKYVIAPGFVSDQAKFDLTVSYALIMFPYLMCMSLAAMMSGILNSLHRYFLAAIAPVFLNIILIGLLYYALYHEIEPANIGFMISWGVLAAGLVQLAIVTYGVRKEGMALTWRLAKMTPRVKRLLILAAPAAVAGGITQINLVIGQMIASGKAGAISVLQYADRVYQLPLGIVGIAVGVVLLPELARALKAGHKVEAAQLQNRSVEFALFLTLPAAAALFVMSEHIVRVLYERGAFSVETTTTVGGVLTIFALGLPAFVLIKAFMPGFFAREDTKTPMRFAAVSVAVNITIALTLFPKIGERGIAMAELAAGWTNCALLYFTLRKRGHWDNDPALWRRIIMLTLSAVIMGVALYFGVQFFGSALSSEAGFAGRTSTLFGLIVAGGIVYIACAVITGGADVAFIKRSLKRKSKITEPDDAI